MERKKIAIFHYHLKRGGVTSVIREQVAALTPDHDVLLLTGEAPEEYIHDNVAVIPGLNYSRDLSDTSSFHGIRVGRSVAAIISTSVP